MTPIETRLDPVTFEILQHKLWQVTNEMGITFTRVTGSYVAIGAKDYATGLFRANGDLMMISCGVLFHAVTIPYGIKHVLERYGREPGIAEGDVFATNDTYICSVHGADIYVLTPIHNQGELVAWAAVMTHLVDTGGIDPGGMCPRATDVWHEGIRLPGIKIVEKGRIRKDVWDTVLNMVRDPGMMGLDLQGMIAAGKTAAQRLTDLISTYGLDTYKTLTEDVIRYAEARMKARLSEFPDGAWQTRVYFDDDGMTDKIYQVAIKMTKNKDTITFDLNGTSEQAPSYINCGIRGAEAGVFGAVAPLIAYDIPWSHGVINAIKVIAPEGTFVHPRFPAPCSLGTTAAADAVMDGVQEVVAKMLMASGAYKEDFTAMWGPAGGGATLAGINQYGQFAVNIMMDACGAGAGARSYADGVNTGGAMYIPEVMVPNAETYELQSPLLFLYRREATDSGGAGKWRGGNSLEYAVTLHDAREGRLLVVHRGRGVRATLTSGLFGGYPAANFMKVIKRDTNVQEKMKAGRVAQNVDELEGVMDHLPANGVTQLTNKDVFLFAGNAGGGYGDPLDRDPALVARDVANRYISLQASRDVYGVAVDPELFQIDKQATDALRQQMREDRVPGTRPRNRAGNIHAQRLAEYIETGHASGTRVVQCARCHREFGPLSANYKEQVAVRELPLSKAGPKHQGIEQFVLREFYCPGCATMLDVEMCRKGDPLLRDFSLP